MYVCVYVFMYVQIYIYVRAYFTRLYVFVRVFVCFFQKKQAIFSLAIPALGALIVEPVVRTVEAVMVGRLGAAPLGAYCSVCVAECCSVLQCTFLVVRLRAAPQSA